MSKKVKASVEGAGSFLAPRKQGGLGPEKDALRR